MPYYDIQCKKCDYEKNEAKMSIAEYEKLKETECPQCGEKALGQNYQKKNVIDIWACSGSTRLDKYTSARIGSQDRLDGEQWKNDYYNTGKHIPEKVKAGREKAKDTAAKMGYTGT